MKEIRQEYGIERRNRHVTYIDAMKAIGLKNCLKLLFVRSNAMKLFVSNFLLTYNLRSGVFLLIRILQVILTKPNSILSLKLLLDETDFRVREEAVRSGLLVGLFTSIYKAVTVFLAKLEFIRRQLSISDTNQPLLSRTYALSKLGYKKKPWHSAIGGSIAGLSIVVMDSSWYRTLALYMATRVVQCVYNYNRERGNFHFWASSWNHGDSLLFALTSAQIMYAYVMRPETLPESYYKFIRKQGPIPEEILKAVRSSIRLKTIDIQTYLNHVLRVSKGDTNILNKILPYIFKDPPRQLNQIMNSEQLISSLTPKKEITVIPLQGIHPYTRSTALHTFRAFSGVATKIFPVYLALALVPAVILRYSSFTKAPVMILIKSFKSSIMSTLFLSLFCAIFQLVVNIQRVFIQKTNKSDSKYIYWLAGLISSSTIFLEKKSRRSELALYALPRAADSIYLILTSRNLIKGLPYGEIYLFSISMGAIMYFYENHNHTLSPLLSKLLSRFLHHDIVIQKLEKEEDSVGLDIDQNNNSSGSIYELQTSASSAGTVNVVIQVILQGLSAPAKKESLIISISFNRDFIF
eukprot:snap_masked-scaffold_2-processed-gene-8.13-mRNA-1 protein AED:0.06 eAED:0.09 QI:0/0/0/0.33/1/1/3/0/577